MKEYLEQEENQTEHEMIRKHIFLATRNYHNRVKSFITNVVMDKNNPMCVEYWTTRVEFQGRGAAHNHGTLWVDTGKMELTYVAGNGRWISLASLLTKEEKLLTREVF